MSFSSGKGNAERYAGICPEPVCVSQQAGTELECAGITTNDSLQTV